MNEFHNSIVFIRIILYFSVLLVSIFNFHVFVSYPLVTILLLIATIIMEIFISRMKPCFLWKTDTCESNSKEKTEECDKKKYLVFVDMDIWADKEKTIYYMILKDFKEIGKSNIVTFLGKNISCYKIHDRFRTECNRDCGHDDFHICSKECFEKEEMYPEFEAFTEKENFVVVKKCFLNDKDNCTEVVLEVGHTGEYRKTLRAFGLAVLDENPSDCFPNAKSVTFVNLEEFMLTNRGESA